MIEKIKSIQNPLTVIAIFAALAEVAGTVALATVDKDIQHIFVWFVMGFPTCLVLFFFATLNFNPRVLYAPSDFKDEDNFINMLAGGREISESFQELTAQLETAKEQILAETVEQVGAAGNTELAKLTAIVNQQIELLRERVELTKESAIETTLSTVREIVRCGHCSLVQFRDSDSLCRRCRHPLESQGVTTSMLGGLYPQSHLQAQILNYIGRNDGPTQVSQLRKSIGRDATAIDRALKKLVRRGLVVMSVTDGVNCVQRVDLA